MASSWLLGGTTAAPEPERSETDLSSCSTVVILVLFVKSEPKPLSPEWLLCFPTECSSGQADVLQHVIVKLAQVAELSARPHSLPPFPQQIPSRAEPGAGAGLPCTAEVSGSRCIPRGAERRLWCHCGPFSVAFAARQRSDVRLSVFHAEICSIFVRNPRGDGGRPPDPLGGFG